MTTKIRGREELRGYIAALPEKLRKNILAGAARAGATVIHDEIAATTSSDTVREDLRIRVKNATEQVIATVDIKPGWGRSLGYWLEYGTDPHFISVDPRFSQGRTARRVNRLDKTAKEEGFAGPRGTLLINGKPVGATVFHPGSQAFPTFRPALDRKEGEAIAAAQAHIDRKLASGALKGPPDRQANAEGDDA